MRDESGETGEQRDASTLLTFREAAEWYRQCDWSESVEQIVGVLYAVAHTGNLPVYQDQYVDERDLRRVTAQANTIDAMPNPKDSPFHQSFQEFASRAWAAGWSLRADDLTPWQHVAHAIEECAATQSIDRRALTDALIARSEQERQQSLPTTVRKTSPKRLKYKYAQANAAARLGQRTHGWVTGEAKRITRDQGIYLAILDRALDRHREILERGFEIQGVLARHTGDAQRQAIELRVAACLANGLDPASTANNVIKCTNTRWRYRARILHKYGVWWAKHPPAIAQGRYDAAVHAAREQHLAELERAVQHPDLYALFGLPSPDALRLVGPEVLRQRRATNLARQRPTKPPQSA